MKKVLSLLTVIALVAVCAVVFTACNNATTQGQLKNVWQDYEKYTYSVSYDGQTGEYVNEIVRYASGASVSVGPNSLKAKNGYLVSGKLTMGTSVVETQCFFECSEGSTYLVPKATYRKVSENGADVSVMSGVYEGSTLNYAFKAAGSDTQTGSVKLSSPYYDNNEFHQSLRGISTFSSSLSFTFNTALIAADEKTSASLNFAVNSTENVTTGISVDNGEGGTSPLAVECYKATLSRSTVVASKTHTLYYAVNDLKVSVDKGVSDEGWPLAHVLVKIVEPGEKGDVTYVLTAIDIVKA